MRALGMVLAITLASALPAQAAFVIKPGNTTDLTLTSAPVLEQLGVTVSPTGTAVLNTSGMFPVAMFPITGGSASGGSLIIDHSGSDLALSAGGTTVDIGNFVVNTQTDLVAGNVALNGGPLTGPQTDLFDIGTGLVLTLTSGAAGALNTAFDTTAFTSSTVIGTATTNPIIAVPEPSTWVMLAGGLGMVALVAECRRRSARRAASEALTA